MAKRQAKGAFFYSDDFIAGVARLYATEIGAYTMLLMEQTQNRRLPTDPHRLAMLAHVDRSEWPAVWDQIGHKFACDEDGYYSEAMERRLVEQDAYRESQAAKGRASAAKRATERQPDGNRGSTEPATERQPKSNPSNSNSNSSTNANPDPNSNGQLQESSSSGQSQGYSQGILDRLRSDFPRRLDPMGSKTGRIFLYRLGVLIDTGDVMKDEVGDILDSMKEADSGKRIDKPAAYLRKCLTASLADAGRNLGALLSKVEVPENIKGAKP